MDDLDTCRQAVAQTPYWSSLDRGIARSVDQVAEGSVGTVTGRLVRIEDGPVTDASDVALASVLLQGTDGSIRSLDILVDGARPLGAATREAFLAAT